MRTFRIYMKLLATAFAFFWAATAAIYGQGVTTSALNGFVTNKDGTPVASATVTAVHDESGTKATTTTRPNGQYSLTSLRPGGPYTITVKPSGGTAEARKGIFLSLQQAGEESFVIGAAAEEVIHLEKIDVSESNDLIFGSGKIATSTSYNAREIMNIPTIRRDIQDIATTDPRFSITPNTSTGEFQLSAQGQNYRFNSLLIDGVKSVDPFGVNGNGFGSLRSPIPLEALEAISLDLNPYDIRRSGFTGGLISAQIKSGTNEVHGSAYVEYSDQRMRHTNPLTGVREPFHERSLGLTIGGPIIENKVFFFFAYDDYVKGAPAPVANFIPDADQLAQVIAKAKSYGYDPGIFGGAATISKQKTYIGKLDWNILEGQRLTLTYRRNDGITPSFAGFTGTTFTSLSNYWFQAPRIQESYTAQLFSDWSPNFHTEATVSYSKYDGTPKNNGAAFPEVFVGGLTGLRNDLGTTIKTGSIDLGTEVSRQLNVLRVKTKNGSLYGDYSIGDHTITFGGDIEKSDIDDRFIQAANGAYSFNTLQEWLDGVETQGGRSSYRYSFPTAGFTLDQSFALFSYYNYGAVVQDVWRPNSRLTLIGGIRLDDPYVPKKTIFNQNFFNAFGYANNTTNSGNYTIAPRVGFKYDVPIKNKMQVRGGMGVFQGTNPAVWIGDPYQNNGSVSAVSGNLTTAPVVFSPDPRNQPKPNGVQPLASYNVTDPNFRQPVALKGNLAVDFTLPFMGIIATIEYNGLKALESPYVVDLNLGSPTTGPSLMPDGRLRYKGNITPAYSGTDSTGVALLSTTNHPNAQLSNNPSFGDVYYMSDSGKGYSESLSFQLLKPMKNHWAASLSYTHGHSTEVNPMTSSVQQSNYNSRAVFNPNDDTDTRSNYSQTHKVVASASYQLNLFKRFATAFSLIYQGTTGHPYSYVFKGDANGDGFINNDLFYVPNGSTDPKVNWNTTTERDNFFAWANSNGLMKWAGRAVPRNSETSNWINTVNIEVTQDIPIYHRAKGQLYIKCINFGNLLNKKWGRVIDQDFPYTFPVAGTTYNANGNGGAGQYNYFFNSSTLGSYSLLTELSRWQLQLGARITF